MRKAQIYLIKFLEIPSNSEKNSTVVTEPIGISLLPQYHNSFMADQQKNLSHALRCSRAPSKHPPQRWRPPQGVAGKHVCACPTHEGFRSYFPLRKNACNLEKNDDGMKNVEGILRDQRFKRFSNSVGQIFIKSMPFSPGVSPQRFAFGTASENLRMLCNVDVPNRTTNQQCKCFPSH